MELWYFPIYYFKRSFCNISIMFSSAHLRQGFVQCNERKQTEILNICILAVCKKAE